jgi:membrane-bound acyltransferase YfiQ involved in biofilm formation
MTTSRINFKIDKRALLFISLFIISAFFLCYKLSINPRIITALMLFTYFFHKGSYFLNYIFSLKFTVITPLYIGVNLLGLYTLFIYNGLIDYKFLAAFLCSVIAISNVIFLIKIFMFFSENKVVNFFSIISFEIYLVHHPLILGKYSLINSFFDNIFINIFFTLLIIIIISWILQYLSQKINKIILIKLIKKTPKKY